jgi:hypothetical protein
MVSMVLIDILNETTQPGTVDYISASPEFLSCVRNNEAFQVILVSWTRRIIVNIHLEHSN